MSQSSTVFRVFKYRLYPSKAQQRNLFRVLNAARHLYNMALEQRKLAWEVEQRSVTIKELDTLAKHYRAKMPYGKQMYSQTAQTVIRQLELAFVSFFRRLKEGLAPGYPRFKSLTQFSSFLFPQYGKGGVKINGRRLKIFGVGRVPVRWHRPIEGIIKTARIVYQAGQWFVCFACKVLKSPPLSKTGLIVGVDVGISSLITTSEGDKVDHPQYYRTGQKRLRVLQRALSRKRKGGHNRRKALIKVQRQHMHVASQRRDFAHKLSFNFVKRYDRIALEDLRITNIVRNRHLSKSILDAGWGIFKKLLTSKAESASREVMFVDPAYTSKTCSNCGALFHHLTLDIRWVNCVCGLSLDRDHNAAINILKRTGWDASI